MSNTAFCFDLDSTITRDEILPLLAREIGLVDEISALTTATLQGVIPFDGSFRLRCKLLQEIPISKAQKRIKNIQLFDHVVSFIKQYPNNCFVIAGNLDVWIKDLLPRIPCGFFCAEASYENDRLLGVKRMVDKAQAIHQIRSDFKQVVTIGDGMGDVPMFRMADIKIAFAAVHTPPLALLNLANYVSYSEKSLCHLLNTLS